MNGDQPAEMCAYPVFHDLYCFKEALERNDIVPEEAFENLEEPVTCQISCNTGFPSIPQLSPVTLSSTALLPLPPTHSPSRDNFVPQGGQTANICNTPDQFGTFSSPNFDDVLESLQPAAPDELDLENMFINHESFTDAIETITSAPPSCPVVEEGTSEAVKKCVFCQEIFDDDGKRREHMTKMHHRCYHCEICTMSFYRKLDVTNHILGHHAVANSFLCRFCGLSFKNTETLRGHFNKVHPSENIFWCHFCDNYCDEQAQLEQHLKDIHRVKSTRCALWAAWQPNSSTRPPQITSILDL